MGPYGNKYWTARISVAYAEVSAVLAIIVIMRCSLILKGPGLRIPEGSTLAMMLPITNEMSWMKKAETVTVTGLKV